VAGCGRPKAKRHDADPPGQGQVPGQPPDCAEITEGILTVGRTQGLRQEAPVVGAAAGRALAWREVRGAGLAAVQAGPGGFQQSLRYVMTT